MRKQENGPAPNLAHARRAIKSLINDGQSRLPAAFYIAAQKLYYKNAKQTGFYSLYYHQDSKEKKTDCALGLQTRNAQKKTGTVSRGRDYDDDEKKWFLP